MTEHTKEPWFHDGDAIYDNADCVGNPIAHVLSCAYGADDNAVDARRIVACVNYCKGLPTEGVITATALGKTAEVSLQQLVDAIAQRDQLLAALDLIVGCENEWASGVAERAIAVVKGEIGDNTL